MAVDQTSKRLNLASRLTIVGPAIIDQMEAAEEIAAESTSAVCGGFQDGDFVGTALKHLDAYTVNAGIGVLTDLRAWLYDAAHPERHELLMKLRP